MTLTLDPVHQPVPRLRTWIVFGTKTLPDGRVSTYTGTAWGRNELDARSQHDRLMDIDRRNREALRIQGDALDLTGYTLTFYPAPEGF